nr:hypothetical protein CFP56_72634 [Quercus suber]
MIVRNGALKTPDRLVHGMAATHPDLEVDYLPGKMRVYRTVICRMTAVDIPSSHGSRAESQCWKFPLELRSIRALWCAKHD